MDKNRLRKFPLFIIGVGSLLVLISLIKGVIMLIAFLKGIPLYTQREISINVINVTFNFVIPFAGGMLLVMSGIMIMQLYEQMSLKEAKKKNRKNVEREVGTVINSSLSQQERKVIEIIRSYPDGTLQSDIVLQSGFSKVKAHRILKKLEGRGLIKRGRFGITNRVILTYSE